MCKPVPMNREPFVSDIEGIEISACPRILAVDDEAGLLKLIISILAARGFTCARARTVREACQAIGSQPFDIIFVDLGLPDGSGFNILEKAMETCPECLIIVITGVHDLQTAVKSIRKGAFDYITKPFSVVLFQERLDSAIKEWKSRMFTHSYQSYLERLVREKTEILSSTKLHMEQVYDTTVHALGAALDLRDPETEEHCRRVSENSVLLGKKIGLGDSKLRDLEWGSYLHDIGKIGIPEGILLKPGDLSEDEMEVVKQHAQLGYSMIKNIDFLAGASDVVLYHHEKWGGDGYPVGLRGKDIPLAARIFAVSDAFDAMIVDRPYRRALPFDVAARELRLCAGSHFDPEIVESFLLIPFGDLQVAVEQKRTKT